MTITFHPLVKNIIILGAGASTDYNLPVWKNLSKLVINEIIGSEINKYKYKKEILEWLDKVGENKTYETIDKCITNESVLPQYDEDSITIENELFLAMKNIFDKRYEKNNSGWIKLLNDKILSSVGLENSLSFINFNYDDVLEKNYLDFSYLPKKHRELNRRLRLEQLSGVNTTAFYPHGKFSESKEIKSYITIHKQTMKSHLKDHLDVVSCYESENHDIIFEDLNSSPLDIYILGLGGGMTINLDKFKFKYNPISNIHVTIKDSKNEATTIKYLSEKYKTTKIKSYRTCDELVNKAF